MFDIRLNEEQRAFQQMARDFAENEIKPIALELDAKPNWEDRIPWDVLKKGSQLGFRSFVLQEENGGAGASDHLTACVVAEELAAGDIGTAYYYMLTARRARDWFELRMTDEQREYFIPRFLEDDTYFTTVAIHEPDTDLGFDYFTETPADAEFRTRAVEQPDRLVLDDRLAAGASFLGVFNGFFERRTAEAEGDRGDGHMCAHI